MKLRIEENAIRIRIAAAEVEQLRHEQKLINQCVFSLSGKSLEYSIVQDNDVQAITALLEGNSIQILVPSAEAKTWLSTDLVSLRAEQAISSGEKLSILLEKDLGCKH